MFQSFLLSLLAIFDLSYSQTCVPATTGDSVDGWIFVIDISVSMQAEIAAVRAAAIDLATTLNNEPKIPEFFVLTEFHNDPLVEPVATVHAQSVVPTDVCDFITQVSNVQTEGGTVCQESPFKGIENAVLTAGDIPGSSGRGNIFVFTDASRNTADVTRAELLPLLQDRAGGEANYRVNFILTSGCFFDFDNGVIEIDPDFSLLASETNGIVIPTDNANVGSAVQIFKDFLVFQTQVPLAQVETTQQVLTNFKVEVSGGVDIIIIIISGAFGSNPQLIVDGDTFDGEDFDYTVESGPGFQKITVDTEGEIDGEVEWCLDINFDAPRRRLSEENLQKQILSEENSINNIMDNDRRRLQAGGIVNRINIYAGDPTVIVDITVSNVNDQNNPVGGSGGNLFYDADGSFVVIGESANDEVLTFTQFSLKSLDDMNEVSNSGADVQYDAVNDVYFTIFDFSDLDTVADVNAGERFVVEAKGLDSQGNQFTRLANLAVSLVEVSVVVNCAVTEFEIFTQTDDACTVEVQRSDDTLSQSYTLSASLDNQALANDVSFLFGTTTISLAPGESSGTTTLDVIISDNELIVGETFTGTVFVNEDNGNAQNFFVAGPFSIPDGTKEPTEEPTPQPTEEPTEERSRL